MKSPKDHLAYVEETITTAEQRDYNILEAFYLIGILGMLHADNDITTEDWQKLITKIKSIYVVTQKEFDSVLFS